MRRLAAMDCSAIAVTHGFSGRAQALAPMDRPFCFHSESSEEMFLRPSVSAEGRFRVRA
jgi:hypothetical protein